MGTTCDADNYVPFKKGGGCIVCEKDNAYMEFERVGSVYVIDVWFRDGSDADAKLSGFTRQEQDP